MAPYIIYMQKKQIIPIYLYKCDVYAQEEISLLLSMFFSLSMVFLLYRTHLGTYTSSNFNVL